MTCYSDYNLSVASIFAAAQKGAFFHLYSCLCVCLFVRLCVYACARICSFLRSSDGPLYKPEYVVTATISTPTTKSLTLWNNIRPFAHPLTLNVTEVRLPHSCCNEDSQPAVPHCGLAGFS